MWMVKSIAWRCKIKNLSPNFRAMVISGKVTHQFSKKDDENVLEPGSYFGA